MSTPFFEDLSRALSNTNEALQNEKRKSFNQSQEAETDLYYAHGATTQARQNLQEQQALTNQTTDELHNATQNKQNSDSLVTAATDARTDAISTKGTVSKAAVKFQEAADSLSLLSGKVAGMLAITTATNHGSPLQKQVEGVAKITSQAAKQAETSSLVSLSSTIEASQTGANNALSSSQNLNRTLAEFQDNINTQLAEQMTNLDANVQGVTAAMERENNSAASFATTRREDLAMEQAQEHINVVTNHALALQDTGLETQEVFLATNSGLATDSPVTSPPITVKIPFEVAEAHMGRTLNVTFNAFPEQCGFNAYRVCFVEQKNVPAFNWEAATNLPEGYYKEITFEQIKALTPPPAQSLPDSNCGNSAYKSFNWTFITQEAYQTIYIEKNSNEEAIPHAIPYTGYHLFAQPKLGFAATGTPANGKLNIMQEEAPDYELTSTIIDLAPCIDTAGTPVQRGNTYAVFILGIDSKGECNSGQDNGLLSQPSQALNLTQWLHTITPANSIIKKDQASKNHVAERVTANLNGNQVLANKPFFFFLWQDQQSSLFMRTYFAIPKNNAQLESIKTGTSADTNYQSLVDYRILLMSSTSALAYLQNNHIENVSQQLYRAEFALRRAQAAHQKATEALNRFMALNGNVKPDNEQLKKLQDKLAKVTKKLQQADEAYEKKRNKALEANKLQINKFTFNESILEGVPEGNYFTGQVVPTNRLGKMIAAFTYKIIGAANNIAKVVNAQLKALKELLEQELEGQPEALDDLEPALQPIVLKQENEAPANSTNDLEELLAWSNDSTQPGIKSLEQAKEYLQKVNQHYTLKRKELEESLAKVQQSLTHSGHGTSNEANQVQALATYLSKMPNHTLYTGSQADVQKAQEDITQLASLWQGLDNSAANSPITAGSFRVLQTIVKALMNAKVAIEKIALVVGLNFNSLIPVLFDLLSAKAAKNCKNKYVFYEAYANDSTAVNNFGQPLRETPGTSYRAIGLTRFNDALPFNNLKPGFSNKYSGFSNRAKAITLYNLLDGQVDNETKIKSFVDWVEQALPNIKDMLTLCKGGNNDGHGGGGGDDDDSAANNTTNNNNTPPTAPTGNGGSNEGLTTKPQTQEQLPEASANTNQGNANTTAQLQAAPQSSPPSSPPSAGSTIVSTNEATPRTITPATKKATTPKPAPNKPANKGPRRPGGKA